MAKAQLINREVFTAGHPKADDASVGGALSWRVLDTPSSRRREPKLLLSAYALGALVSLVGCNQKSQEMQTSSTESTQTAAAKKPAQQSSLSGVVDLDPKEFERKHQELGGTLLDVRTPAEIAQFRIDGASTVDINDPQFRSKIDKLAKDQPVFVYCHSGGRSARAAKMLKEAGVTQVYNLDGGISAWKRAQLATVSSPLAQPEEPAKETTLAEFDAKLQNSPVVLAEFQTQWCAPCVGMRPVVEQLRNKHGDDKVVVVDVDASEALATREKASGVPVFVLYQKGRETFRHSGALSFEELDAKLNQAP